MNEELKAAIQEQFEQFKSTLNKFIDKDGLNVAFGDFKKEMATLYGTDTIKESLTKLEKAIDAQGLELAKMAENRKNGNDRTEFKEALAEKLANFKLDGTAKTHMFTTQKAVTSANFTDDTMAYRAGGIGEIKRGVPFIRNLFQVVQLGSDSHDTVRWFEQASVTNNAHTVAEIRTVGTQSGMTWVEKSLNSRRLFDYVKIGVDRIKDVSFVMGEVERLVNRNMRLKENDALINGDGTGNNIAGILSYATAFDATGIVIDTPNLVDLLGKVKTQIDKDMLGAAVPSHWIANRIDVDNIRYKKDAEKRYLFEAWALGSSDVNVAGMIGIENPLVTQNTLLAGDMSLATLYVWDDLVLELGRTEDDMLKGYVTLTAYMRENLRVQDVDKKGIVKVADLAATLTDLAS